MNFLVNEHQDTLANKEELHFKSQIFEKMKMVLRDSSLILRFKHVLFFFSLDENMYEFERKYV